MQMLIWKPKTRHNAKISSTKSTESFLLKLPERLGASFSGWDLVLFVFGGIYLLSAVFWLGINPNRTIESKTA